VVLSFILSAFTSQVTLTCSISPVDAGTLSPSSITFVDDSTRSLTFNLPAPASRTAATVTLTCSSDNTAGYTTPDPYVFNVYNTLQLQDTTTTLQPGQSETGNVILGGSPHDSLIVTLASVPSGLVFSPSSFTFFKGQSPYKLQYTLSSTQPGNYYVVPSLSGPDANTVQPPLPNVSYTVTKRSLNTNPTGQTNIKVGQTTKSYLLYTNIPPDVALTCLVYPSDPSVTVNPAQLVFTPTTLTQSYTLTGTKTTYATITTNCTGPDADKYAFPSSGALSVANRTIVTPSSYDSLATGVPSKTYSMYTNDPADPSKPVFVTLSSPDDLAFQPSVLRLDSSTPVATFTMTANNNTGPATRQIVYTLSGDSSYAFTTPASSAVNVGTNNRTLSYYTPANPNSLPYNSPVSLYISLSSPPPSSVSVAISGGTNCKVTPNVLTFTNTTATLTQSLTLVCTVLGTVRLTFDISGQDQSLVNTFPSLAFTVVKFATPQIIIAETPTIGIPFKVILRMPNPVITSMDVSFITSPSSNVVNPTTMHLVSPGLNAGSTDYPFTITPSSSSSFVLKTLYSGADSLLFPPTDDVLITVTAPSFVPSLTVPSQLVINVPVSIGKVVLNPASATTVTLTPSCASLKFIPATLNFGPEVNEICVTIIPTQLITTDTIVWTSSDPINYNAPAPITIGPIIQKSFSSPTIFGTGISVVVGVATLPIEVIVDYPPSAGNVILTPTSTDGLVFSPSSLTFTPAVDRQYFTITAPSLTNQLPVISYVVSGTEASSYAVPAYGAASVSGRSVSVSGTLGNCLVGVECTPVVVASDYPVQELTITPTAPGVTFNPPSQTLTTTNSFASFTATYPVWQDSGSSVTKQVQLIYSGANAAWFTPQTVSFSASKRSIQLSTSSFTVYTDKPGVPVTFTLQAPPENSLSISICLPSYLSAQPNVVQFAPGQWTGTAIISSISALGNGPSSALLSFDVLGTDANKYNGVSNAQAFLSYPSGLSLVNFPSSVVIGDAPTVFEISMPFTTTTPFTIVPTSESGSLTFSPAQLYFDNTTISHFVSCQATNILHHVGSSSTENVVFEIIGLTGIYGSISQKTVTIQKRAVTLSVNTNSAYVGNFISSTLNIQYAPRSGSITFTASPCPGMTVIPSVITFTTSSQASFIVSSNTVGSCPLGWRVSGPEAAFYTSTTTFTYFFSAKSISVQPSGITLQPGTLPVILYSLNVPVTQDLTITPVLPNAIVATPASLSLKAGQSTGIITLSGNPASTSLYSDDYNVISSTVTGSDAASYGLPGAFTVYLTKGSIGLNGLSNCEVGTTCGPVEITLSAATINGMTCTVTATGATVSPSQVPFWPGSSRATFMHTPTAGGVISFGFNCTGKDAWLYSPLASQNVQSTLRTIAIDSGISFASLSNAVVRTIALSTPPPTGLTITPIGNGIFSPTSITYVPGLSSQQFSFTPTSCGNVNIRWQIDGADAGWYAPIGLNTLTIPVSCISTNFDFPSSILSNVATPGTFYLTSPASVTVTPTAPGCAFNPPTFVFNKDTLSCGFTCMCNAVSSGATSVNVVSPAASPLAFAVSGDDANLISPLSGATITLVQNVLTVPSSMQTYSNYPVILQFNLANRPAVPFVVTPTATHFTFNPSSITFKDITSAQIVCTPTSPTEPKMGTVSYNISGDGSSFIGLSSAITSINSRYGVLASSFAGGAVGDESIPFSQILTPSPVNGVTFTPYAPGCEFHPATADFGPLSNVVTQTITCNSPGNPTIQYKMSGPDAKHYRIPDMQQISISARTSLINMPTTSPQIWDDNYGTIILNTPAEKSLTITPRSSLFKIEPASLIFPAGASSMSFKYTAISLGSDMITFDVSDADAGLYATPPPMSVSVGQRIISPKVPNLGNIYTGSSSNTFSVVLDRSPPNGLVIQPYGAGATYTPNILSFAPGQTGLSFVLKAVAVGSYPLCLNVSGADAQYYSSNNLCSTINVRAITARIVTTNFNTPYVGVISPPLLVTTDFPPSDVVTVSCLGQGFTPSTVTLSPTTTSATFQYTSSAVGPFTIQCVISGNAAPDFSNTLIQSISLYANKRIIRYPNSLADVFVNAPSTPQSIALDYAPDSDLTVTPTAPNVMFSPTSLSFTSQDYNQKFTCWSNQTTQFNNAPGQTGSLAPTTVTWTLSGTNAGWYTPIPNQQFNILPRDINVRFLNQQILKIWFNITISTSYPAASDITFNLVGNFQFSPASIVLPAGETTVIVGALPLAAGSNSFRVLIIGAAANMYQYQTDWGVQVSKWSFSTPALQTIFQIGEWGSPLIVRPSHVPSDNVILTITSDYLEVNNSVLTFGTGSASGLFSLRLRKGLDYLRITTFTVYYRIGGPAAWLFNQPGSSTLSWSFSSPPRVLTVSNFPTSLVVGVPSAPFSVMVPTNPFDSLTITPVPYSPHVHFNPPSVTLTRDNYNYISTFTVTVDHPSVTGSVKFLCTGMDAVYYTTPTMSISNVNTRTIAFVYPSAAVTVGIPSNPFVASVYYDVPHDMSVVLSSTHATFTPNVLTFGPGVSSVPFTVTAYAANAAIPVTVATIGTDQDWFTPASSTFPSLSVNQRLWTTTPNNLNLLPGQIATIDYAVDTAPNNDVTIAPYATGLTFTPASITLKGGMSSASFLVNSSALNPGGSIMNTVITGTDAAWYQNIASSSVVIGALSVTVPTLNSQLNVDCTDQQQILISLSAPVNGLYISVSANGLKFDRTSYYVPPGHSYCHASFVAVAPGLSTVRISLSGPDANLYVVSQPASPIRVYQHLLSSTAPNNVYVGTISPAIQLYSYGGTGNRIQRNPLDVVNVNFLVSPDGAATIYPSTVTLDPQTSSAEIQITPNIPGTVTVTPVLSGPGAAIYTNIPGSNPNPISITAVKRTFTITDPFNSLAITNQRQLFVGEVSHTFGVTCNGIPSKDVILYLQAPGCEIIPSALRFTGTFETIYFKIRAFKAITTQITYSVGGADAALYLVPAASAQIRVTHQFVIPPLQTVNVGIISKVHTISITSPLTSSVYLTPAVGNCPSSVSPQTPRYVTFFPPYLLFTPNSTTQSFTYIGNCASNNLGNNFNPVITASATNRYSNGPTTVPVSWQVTEAGETPYVLSLPINNNNDGGGVLAVGVVQIPFNVKFGPLALGKTGYVQLTVPVPPRSDVVLTLIGNNLNFFPPHAVFSPTVTNVTLQVSYAHGDYKDSMNIPFTVDYIISGTNWQDYIPPAQTYLGVGRGKAPVVGGISGSDATVTSVSVYALLAMALVALLL